MEAFTDSVTMEAFTDPITMEAFTDLVTMEAFIESVMNVSPMSGHECVLPTALNRLALRT